MSDETYKEALRRSYADGYNDGFAKARQARQEALKDLRQLASNIRAFIAEIKCELRRNFNQNIEAACNNIEITVAAAIEKLAKESE